MRLRDALLTLAFAVLALLVGAFAARVTSHWRGARVELGRVKLSAVDDDVAARLAALEDPVLLTYYVSPRGEMPSHLRRLEDRVTDVLRGLERASGGRVEVQVLDPHEAQAEDEEVDDGQAKAVLPESKNARYAARQGIAPFRVRSIAQDAWSERTIWSSLTIAYGAYPPVVVNGIGPDHVPRLQATIVAHLDQMEAPRRPTVALAAPPQGFARLRAELERHAEVTTFDPAGGAPFPREADVLFWIDPREVGRETLRELDRFLHSGRSVVLAASRLAVAVGDRGPDGGLDPTAFRVRPSGFDAETLFGHLGLRPLPGLLCDEFSVVHRDGPGEDAELTPIPFLVRCIAPNQRFSLNMGGTPNGTLLFEAPTGFALDPEVLADEGYAPEVLAHTSDDAWFSPVPDTRERPADARALGPESGRSVAREPLAVLLSPTDPWRGSVVVLSSSACFRDDWIRADGVAHPRLVDVLLRHLGSDERLVVNRTEVARSEPVPELAPGERALWRAVCVFLLPAGLLLLALARGAFGSGLAGALSFGRSRAGTLGLVAGALALGLALVRAADLLPLRSDWTADGLNRLAPKTAALAREARGAGALRVELLVSRRQKLPPAMRPAVDRLEGLVSDLRRAGAELEVVRVHPEELAADERERLAAEGVEPVRVTTREEGVTTVRTVYSAVRLSRASGEAADGELLRLPDLAAFEELEFRVAFALWRLATGERAVIAFASDAPRLSPAEAYTDYQQKGLFAPGGEDAYSLARAHLRAVGFDVVHVNPREPVFPPDFDALLWLQPRREARPMIEALAHVLHGGGRALLAAQHFNLQARQYRGTNFKTVYWPQPQTPDIDLYWLPELGIELVRDVVFDELIVRRRMETQVNRNSSRRDYEDQESALPFLIRAAAANFADDPVTRGVGDLAFTFGNRIRWDDERLAELGLEAKALVRTSERAWSFAWTGGYLPDSVLAGYPDEDLPGDEEGGGAVTRLSREVLAARFTGSFPLPVEELNERGSDELPPYEGLVERPAAPGELLLVGASEPFKNGALFGPELRGDHLLVNAAAHLSLPADLAAVAGRRRVARGFDLVGPESKREWRAIVVAAGPALLLLVGLLRRLAARRAPRVGGQA